MLFNFECLRCLLTYFFHLFVKVHLFAHNSTHQAYDSLCLIFKERFKNTEILVLANQNVHYLETHHITLIFSFVWRGEFAEIEATKGHTLDLFEGFNYIVSFTIFLEDNDPMFGVIHFSLELSHVWCFYLDIAPIDKTFDTFNNILRF